VRRRRAVAGVGAVAAVAALAVAVPAVVDGMRDDGAPPVATRPTPSQGGGFETRTTTYAIGSSIYYGEQAIDVSPYDVRAFVQTDDGFVVAATDGTVVLADGETVDEIGTATARRGYAALAADDHGGYVTWVEDRGAGSDFVVYDTAARDEAAREADPDAPVGEKPAEFALPVVEALDEGVAYWHRSHGTVAYDIASGETTGYLARDADGSLEVVEVATGGPASTGLQGPRSGMVQWTADDAFVAYQLASDDASTVDLVECSITTKTCTVTAAQVGVLGSVVLPDGLPAS
jgi:hypothetical protein